MWKRTLELFKHLWKTAEKLPKKLVEEIKEHLPNPIGKEKRFLRK